jgi:hypothetical protein
MSESDLLFWLYASLDELIDFDGYRRNTEDEDYGRGKFIETCNKFG